MEKVYFNGNFGHHVGDGRAGIKISLEESFDFAGREWCIPAMYKCKKGVVLDFCVKIPKEEIQIFLDQWMPCEKEVKNYNFSNYERMMVEKDDPFKIWFKPVCIVNEKKLFSISGCSVKWNPCIPKDYLDTTEQKMLMSIYGLDENEGWEIYRYFFPWPDKRKQKIQSLEIIMKPEVSPVMGERVRIRGKGDRVEVVNPVSGEKYTLTVEEYAQEEMLNGILEIPEREVPKCYIRMTGTVFPKLPMKVLRFVDCKDGDQPRKKAGIRETQDQGKHSVGVSMIQKTEEEKVNACSSMYFEVPEKIEWMPIFYIKKYEDVRIKLI